MIFINNLSYVLGKYQLFALIQVTKVQKLSFFNQL